MKINACFEGISSHKTDVLVIGTFSDFCTDDAKKIDSLLGNTIKSEMSKKRFRAEFNEILVLNTFGKLPADIIIVIGLGKKKDFTADKLRRVAGFSAKTARSEGAVKLTTSLGKIRTEGDSIQAAVEGTMLGLYRFNHFKTQDLGKIRSIESVMILGDKKDSKAVLQSIKKAEIVSQCVINVRDLVNTPSDIKTPAYLADQAKRAAKEGKFNVKVFGKSELKKLGCNAIIAVSEGSSNEPKMVVIDYSPRGAKETIALVGKGVTFDSGGLDIKPADSMETMRNDMAGAATVLNVIRAASKLGIKKRIIGVMPLVENMPGPNAEKPGDIITAYNKKTIEMVNSDAEGRLILADALSYVEKNYKPNKIIDLATLTGACIVALGYHAAAVLGNDHKLIESLKESGNETHERVWELPLWDEYKELIKSETADVSNMGKKGCGAGTINGATFLSNFIEKTPWAHLDIAGVAYINEEREYAPKNATGWGVRLLINWLEK